MYVIYIYIYIYIYIQLIVFSICSYCVSTYTLSYQYPDIYIYISSYWYDKVYMLTR